MWRRNMIYGQHASTIIRLYDTIGDQAGGIKFIDQMFSDSRALFGKKEVSGDNEFMKLRNAFEEDRNSGKNGTPTKVIIESKHLAF